MLCASCKTPLRGMKRVRFLDEDGHVQTIWNGQAHVEPVFGFLRCIPCCGSMHTLVLDNFDPSDEEAIEFRNVWADRIPLTDETSA